MPKIGANKLNFLPVCHKELGDEKSVDLCMTLFQLRNSLRFEINSFSEEDLFTHRVIQKKKSVCTQLALCTFSWLPAKFRFNFYRWNIFAPLT